MPSVKVGKLVLLAAAAVAVNLAAPAVAQADDSGVFLSPSGNIICNLVTLDGSTSAMCEIRTYTYTVPQAKPTNCGVGWGDRVKLEENAPFPTLSCHGDSAFGMAAGQPTLQYGQSRTVGTITCTSRTTGMTCKDAGTGRYFQLSRDALTLA